VKFGLPGDFPHVGLVEGCGGENALCRIMTNASDSIPVVFYLLKVFFLFQWDYFRLKADDFLRRTIWHFISLGNEFL
jgi:hypothetical protein